MTEGKAPLEAGLYNNIEIELSSKVISDALLSDPAFITAVAKEIRKQLLKDARFLGNLFGKWAATKPTPPGSKRRLNQ